MLRLQVRCSLRAESNATPRIARGRGVKASTVGRVRACRATSKSLHLLPLRGWNRTAVASNTPSLRMGASTLIGFNRTSEGRRKDVVRTASEGAEPVAENSTDSSK
eukprot:867701-Pyramimonas_sp.AAC.1